MRRTTPTDGRGRPTIRIGSTDVARSATPAEQSARLWAMTRAERVEAMRAGRLSMVQCCEWAQRRAWEVPLINGEFAFIAAHMDEYTNPTPQSIRGAGQSQGEQFQERCRARLAAEKDDN